MAVLARAWKDSGGTVIGLAPSAVAAAALGEQIGSHTDTLTKLTWSLTHDRVPAWVDGIGPDTLVIIDEAAMAGTADLAATVDYITAKGGAVRLVSAGDMISKAFSPHSRGWSRGTEPWTPGPCVFPALAEMVPTS